MNLTVEQLRALNFLHAQGHFHVRLRDIPEWKDSDSAFERVEACEAMARMRPALVDVHRASIGEIDEHARYTLTAAGRRAAREVKG